MVFTEGAHHVAEAGGAFWLLDEIAIIQPYDNCAAGQDFQVWTLTVRENRSASLVCEDGNGNVVFTKEIEYTDFPLATNTLWFANNTIYLPSEH